MVLHHILFFLYLFLSIERCRTLIFFVLQYLFFPTVTFSVHYVAWLHVRCGFLHSTLWYFNVSPIFLMPFKYFLLLYMRYCIAPLCYVFSKSNCLVCVWRIFPFYIGSSITFSYFVYNVLLMCFMLYCPLIHHYFRVQNSLSTVFTPVQVNNPVPIGNVLYSSTYEFS
jgi:hypothetical protein